ncbi:hypothetical protein [Marinomonas spartinae]|uniref:Uncharacterized protein n=1 Tax=Marinomonas spartinae TaxID=1792290 RepID=A0A1A8TQR6_9GAMM|nr:hypothetical protein [Marinomonas spartinae]MBJ7554439.1 hypothetical protein [Marinomonas spartinae]SBS35192.1 hypothetical protein MSP8886_03304 [Marinomonas spartinae]
MKANSYEDLSSLYQWMDFIVNEKDIDMSSIDCNLKIFGDGDDAYLVINVYGSDTNSTEYYFKPDDTENGLMALISCVRSFNFSLKELLEKLPFQNYVENDVGCYASVKGIKIFKENVVSN